MSARTEPEEGLAVQPATADHDSEIETDSAPRPEGAAGSQEIKPSAGRKPLRFYAILVALGFTGLLTALEGTITSVALPTIIDDLGGASLYIWVVNVYFLTTTAFQPLFGQVANIFGRRYPTLIATATFCLGSGVCGGAKNVQMLIVGRAIQGAGASGINVLAEIIICDLVPLRERGYYVAVIFGFITLGSAGGPICGGLLVEHVSWRWIFYLNLPIGGTAFLLLALVLQVRYQGDGRGLASFKRIDWTGNVVLVLSVLSILTALSWAGTRHAWSSYQIILPMVLGFIGCVAFVFYEGSRYCVQPTMPLHLFRNRTSSTAYALTFIHSILTLWTVYFLPVYFQGVLGSSPGRSGVQLLPTIFFAIPLTLVAGRIMSSFGLYRPIHHVGFAVMTIGFGLFSLFDGSTSTAEWLVYQAVEAAGAGLIIPALLPAVQAELSDADTALSTSTWAFVRSFGMIWGVTVPAAMFNNLFDRFSARIGDAAVVADLAGGGAYEHATKAFLDGLPSATVRSQVIGVFSDSLQTIWYAAVALAGLAFVLVMAERAVPMRKELEGESVIADTSAKNSASASESARAMEEKE